MIEAAAGRARQAAGRGRRRSSRVPGRGWRWRRRPSPMRSVSWRNCAEGPSYRGGGDAFADRARSRIRRGRARPADAALDYLDRCVDRPGITTASPRFMGYVPGGGLFHSAIGDFLAAASNKYAGFAPAAPGAVRLENATVRLAGPDDRLPGHRRRHPDLGRQHGQSHRHRRRPRGAGRGGRRRRLSDPLRPPLHRQGASHRRPGAGAAAADRDRRAPPDARRRARRGAGAGLRPTASGPGWSSPRRARSTPARSIRSPRSPSFASAMAPGSTSTAPMAGCSCCARKGGRALGGIERADTVALDPHKTLFLPYGTGAVVARDGRTLLDAFSASADYIRPLRRERRRPVAGRSLARADPPFPGAPAVAAASARRGRAPSARRSPRRSRSPAISTRGCRRCRAGRSGPPPDLSIVAFRYRPAAAMRTPSTDRLLQRLQEEGRVFLSGTRIDGADWLRCAILSFRTHLEHVDETIDVLGRTRRRAGGRMNAGRAR